MALNNAYSAYQKTNVTTASQGHLVVLLYEACVKNLNSALALIENGDKIKPSNIENFSKLLQKAQAIITELQVSLDMEKGGDISKNLMSLYLYFNSELTDVAFNHSAQKLTFVLDMVKELLGAWKSASSSTANAPAQTSMQAHTALNIQG
ncbi:MAG: flagellar export chaperone FliS [Treponema sp.]|nr:flagellar export chaperone FliS [Treponema sp.]